MEGSSWLLAPGFRSKELPDRFPVSPHDEFGFGMAAALE
jgi:hypothetical protein